uniref:Uncharacterized protein n=1 Tax=Avena sativa TaxID=4498 RepID=A0ACD5Y5R4_AVESA
MAGRLLAPLLVLMLLQLPAPSQAHASPGTAAAAHSGRCPSPEEALPPFVAGLRRTCRASTEGHPAEEVNGEELIKKLGGKEYIAVLFYASWCPFSQRMRPVFDDLSSMYPQIKHLAVEQSNVMPAVLSRYGVRSLPSILIAHESYAFWPLVAKDLDSLVSFYTAVNGQEPLAYLGPRTWNTTGGNSQYAKIWNGSVSESVKSEPYLAFSILFICLRIFLFFFPKCFACIKGLWTQYFRHANLGVLAKLAQLLECVPQAVDVRKMWSKWRLMVGAMNTRVWASSLASVSLGGQSSPRAAGLD